MSLIGDLKRKYAPRLQGWKWDVIFALGAVILLLALMTLCSRAVHAETYLFTDFGVAMGKRDNIFCRADSLNGVADIRAGIEFQLDEIEWMGAITQSSLKAYWLHHSCIDKEEDEGTFDAPVVSFEVKFKL